MRQPLKEYERKDTSVTVTLLWAPSPWLASLDDLLEIPVRCVIGRGAYASPGVELAEPLRPLPDDLVRAVSAQRENAQRRSFREALKTAVEASLGYAVVRVTDGVVDWEAGG